MRTTSQARPFVLEHGDAMRSRPRVLIIAEAANPEWASVPLVGWNVARALSAIVDAHVVTQVRNKAAIERTGWSDGVEFTSIDSEAVARPVSQFSEAFRRVTGSGWTVGTALTALPYYYFEHLVWKRFGAAIENREFDIVHRVTPLSPTTPSMLARKCRRAGVPFILGPLNGGVAWPREFSDVRRQEGEWLSALRDLHLLMPGARSTRRDAAAILVGSRATWEHLAAYHEKCVYLPENGIDPSRFPERERPMTAPPLRVAFIGRLVPYKGADMLVEAAIPLVRSGALTLDILGDGPQTSSLQRQIAESGLPDGIHLHGWVPHERLAATLANSHVFAFPSVREFGGAVVIEAMAMGLVPVVVDYAGPAELVTAGTGFRIPLGPRGRIVERFRETLAGLAADTARLEPLRYAARHRALTLFTWQRKAQQILEVYSWVLGTRAKPDFAIPLDESAKDEQAT